MVISKTNYLYTNYLSNYELINKYNAKSVYKRPQLNALVLKISLKNFIDLLDLDKVEELNFQLKLSIFFYIIFSSIPLINYYQFKSAGKKSKGKRDGDFTIKMVLSDRYIINSFLLACIVGNPKLFLHLSKKEKNFYFVESGKFSYSFKINASIFKDVEEFFVKDIKNFNIKKLFIGLNLNFSNFSDKGSIVNSIKNSIPVI